MNKEELTRLYNTLVTIETRGAHTKTMADCLRFIENALAREEAPTYADGDTGVEK